MRHSISDTAEFGDLTRGPKVIDDGVRANMSALLEEIRSGGIARDWIAEMDGGEPELKRLRKEASETRIEQVGRELRSLMQREESEARGVR